MACTRKNYFYGLGRLWISREPWCFIFIGIKVLCTRVKTSLPSWNYCEYFNEIPSVLTVPFKALSMLIHCRCLSNTFFQWHFYYLSRGTNIVFNLQSVNNQSAKRKLEVLLKKRVWMYTYIMYFISTFIKIARYKCVSSTWLGQIISGVTVVASVFHMKTIFRKFL